MPPHSTVCLEDGCEREMRHRWLCHAHYEYRRKRGLLPPKMRPDVWERFARKVDFSGECWTWTGTVNHAGYGNTSHEGKPVRAHRLYYGLFFGPIPRGQQVLHRCDNPPCVRPDHLFLGTIADNMHDRDGKGRTLRGEQARFAKFTDEELGMLRRQHKRGATVKGIARRLGVDHGSLWRALHGATWKHVAEAPCVERHVRPKIAGS